MYTPEQQVVVLSWVPTASKQEKRSGVADRVSLGQFWKLLWAMRLEESWS